jgi:ligand-binding sensor domain-containing protein
MYKVMKNRAPASRRDILDLFRLRVSCLISILFLLPLLLSACATDSGILGGGNWQSTGLQDQHIRALEVDPNNQQNIFAGDTQGIVFVSNDAGQHWKHYSIESASPNAISALLFDETGKKLYAATEQGLFASSDGAQQWSTVATSVAGFPADSYTALAFDVNAPQVMYAGTEAHGLFVSTNDGVNWSSISNGLPQHSSITSVANDPAQHQLWVATPDGAYRSDDKGASWHAFMTGFPAGIGINTIMPASVGGGTKGLLYAGTNKGLYLSLDSGAHWATAKESLVGTSIHAILVDFRSSNASTIYVCTDVGVLRSNDEGQSWSGIASGLPQGASVYAIVLGASNYTQLYVATNGVYMFPGNSGGLSPSRIVFYGCVLAFFYLLFRMSQRGQNRRRNLLKPEHIKETPPSTPIP